MVRTDPGTTESLLSELRTWVEMETPTTDAAAVNRLMDKAQADLAAVTPVERIRGSQGYGDMLIARTPNPGGRKGIFVAGHLDTVWPVGTLAKMPFNVEGDRAHGPGIYDMKAGSFIAFNAVREIIRQGTETRLPITLLLTSEEEVGSLVSRPLIEAEAAKAKYVLIPEPAIGAQGAVVTARKGVGRFDVAIRGVSAHAGGNFQDGVSATVELAHQLLAVQAMTDLARGITTNIAPVWGGTRPNVVAAEAGFEVDLRVPTVEDGERLTAAIRGLKPVTQGASVTVRGQMNRPPFAETAPIMALYERARALAAGLGFDLPKIHRGGGSDGNFPAALGMPVLDGLGAMGAGAHADHEHILVSSLVPRSKLMLGLLETLD
ncbi:MAG: M20 family metallopeptidase [Alphaproteobacteria bacterium]|nr:M20 family metallopeptidase [Alphaproteobacteria bacterium]